MDNLTYTTKGGWPATVIEHTETTLRARHTLQSGMTIESSHYPDGKHPRDEKYDIEFKGDADDAL